VSPIAQADLGTTVVTVFCLAILGILLLIAGLMVLAARMAGQASRDEEIAHCPDCGRRVSPTDVDCPGCGRRLKV